MTEKLFIVFGKIKSSNQELGEEIISVGWHEHIVAQSGEDAIDKVFARMMEEAEKIQARHKKAGWQEALDKLGEDEDFDDFVSIMEPLPPHIPIDREVWSACEVTLPDHDILLKKKK